MAEAGLEKEHTISDLKFQVITELIRRKLVDPETTIDSQIAVEIVDIATLIEVHIGLIYTWIDQNLLATLPFNDQGKRYFRLIDILRILFIKNRYDALTANNTRVDYKALRRGISSGWNARGLPFIAAELQNVVAAWDNIALAVQE